MSDTGEVPRLFPGFTESVVAVNGTTLFVRHGGSGTPILLLHGHPRTSATWHRVAPRLVAAGFTVVAPDLRGYGRSGKPEPDESHRLHSKRAMATDAAELMTVLGFDRFAVAGHDRGSYVALRLALDHPARVTRLVSMDGVPISEAIERADACFATAWWHWFFFAQPEIPERVITADPDAWYADKADAATMGVANHDELMRAVHDPRTIRGMLEDYRAGLTVDLDDERADRLRGHRVACPVLLLWSSRDDLEDLYGDPLAVWAGWADDRRGARIESGHHMAEEAPDQVAAAIAGFARSPSASSLKP
ncbi:alpha/beta hydrolase [Microbacterium sp. CFBP9034]|uniref:alpha/beta fold hydrolase n=1 Tax=Microbacterium sp. CFBP9034 TaxID=3096540 RepID=UPI002A6AD956|nr:alpha/beta hydrolase [Microbacterium sp. CFBP9034]MDY0908579.1 alpha/beta hydrolase [Microbacterium sp. CFBP9034]